jgi:hypothetical protein
MTTPSGDPVEQRAARNAGQVPEFYRPPALKPLGDPASDPPLTVRVQGGQDRATRYSPDALRVIRTADVGAAPWVEVAGPEIGWRFTDTDVAGWPVVAAVVNETAFARPAAAPGPPAQSIERGDMGVEAFKGGSA